MIEAFIIIIGFISLTIVGIWYDKIVPPISSKATKLFTFIPRKSDEGKIESIDDSVETLHEYPKFDEIKDAKITKMTKYHFAYLMAGVAFWGVIIGSIFNIFVRPEISLFGIVTFSTVLTAIVTLYVQYSCRGFDIEKPRHWFFIPIGSWILILIWLGIEAILYGETSIFLDLFR